MAEVGGRQGGERTAGAVTDRGLSPLAETAPALEAYLTPPFRANAHRWDDEGQVCSSGRITHRHACPWEWIVEAYFGRMRNNNFLPNSTVTTVLGSKEVTDLGAFQFDITIPIPWALRAIAGSTEATMIERGHVDTERRELTLVCWASWGTIGCCTEKSVYSEVPAEQGGGCVLVKTNRVEIHSPMLPKWAVDTFWRVKNRNFPKSREEHERLALRLMDREGQKPGRPVPSLPKHWGAPMCEASPPPSPSPAVGLGSSGVGRGSPVMGRGSADATATGGESSPRTGGRTPSPEVVHPTKVTVLGSEGDRISPSRAVQRRAKASGCFCARRPAKTIADRRPSARSPNGSATRRTENEVWHTAPAGWVPQNRPETPRVPRKTTSNAATAKKILAQPAAMGPTELLTLIATAEAATQKFSLNVNFSRSDRALKVDSAGDTQDEPADEEDEDWLTPKSEFPVDSWPGIEVVVRAGESRNQATVRTLDELAPGPKTPNLGKEGAYDGALGYDLLTEVTANCVFRQPWDRLVLTYLYRIHTGLADDLSATLRPIQPVQPGSSILVLEYDFALELPAAVRIFAGESHYRWVETVQIDTAERRLRSYSKSPMWTDKFSSLEFIEFHGVDDGVTFCRKGLIADTPRAFPPKWIMNLVARSYDTRSRETCVELNDFADRAEQIVGAQQPDSLRVWDHLGWDEVTERTPKAEIWFSQP
eukprot:COSAG02_NODE_1543_length_12003_cov_16.681536_11_plen_707_part_00